MRAILIATILQYVLREIKWCFWKKVDYYGNDLGTKDLCLCLSKTDAMGVPVSINGKVNVGRGRPLANLEA